MEFIDHTGHIFSLPTFDDKPIALEYKENDYIFWLKDQPVSINNYYILPIRLLLDYHIYIEEANELVELEKLDPENVFNIKISIDSNFFKLIGPKYVQEKMENSDSIIKPIEFNINEFKSELTLSDFYYNINLDSIENLIVYHGTKKFLLFPFYVIGKSSIEGTYMSNINIEVSRYKQESSKVSIKLENDEMFDYYMKKIVTDINIYQYSKKTQTRRLWYTIKTGYNPITDEILYPSKEILYSSQGIDYSKETYSSLDPIKESYEDDNGNIIKPTDVSYRIRHFSGHLPSDVFVYIHRIPKSKWLLDYDIYERDENTGEWIIDPETNWFVPIEGEEGTEDNELIYTLEGRFKRSCNYCGSALRVNHDGSHVIKEEGEDETTNSIEGSYVHKWTARLDSKKYANGDPIYPEDWDENNVCKKMFLQTNYSSFGTINYGEAFDLNPNYGINLAEQAREDGDGKINIIRDIWFDIDLELNNIINGEYKIAKEYTPITVGCTFIDECEELIINGKNMGINLPKEIIKAIYSSSFYNKYADEKLLKNKMKEILLNYMSIKGECGNFKSMLNSLKWFGWGDKIEISKLLKTDNEFQSQFILDYFTLDTDLKETYKYFNTTNLISLSVKENNETGEIDLQDYDNILIGEGKPLLEDLFNKIVSTEYDEIKFYKPYYDFMFNELALKLDCLAHYYQKYFLPIHIKINRASIEHKVYANTLKHSSTGFQKIVETPVFVHINSINVSFGDNYIQGFDNEVVFHDALFYKSNHYIDNKFNEFSNYNENYTDEDLYYVNENCIFIPIKIKDSYESFSEYEYGDYLCINDEYVKIYEFYIYNKGLKQLIQTDDLKNATHCKLFEDSTEYIDLSKVLRYSNVTEGYFNCKLFFSYLDNETQTEKIIVNDNTFSFYQKASQYYANYVIIPRLIKDKSFDWLNTKFKLTLVINNKWYDYYFIVKTPNIYLDLGKLEYRYLISGERTMFNQIQKIDNDKIYFNSFMYQPDLVSIDTLFYDKDKDKVMTFIEKLIDIDDDNKKLYDFYLKYYKNQISVPYNEKYYNKVHIFNIHKTKNKNYGGIEYIVKIEGWGKYTSWGNEWSPVNGGQDNIIKGFIVYCRDLFETYQNSYIIAHRENNDVTLRIDSSNIENEILFNDENDGIIEYIEVFKDEDDLLETLYSYEGKAFDNLYLVDGGTIIDHSHRYGPWWYTKDKVNTTQIKDLSELLEYDGNPNNIELYQEFFDSNYNFKYNIENNIYDIYLMHDEPSKEKKYWYLVLISKYPISSYTQNELKIHKNNISTDNYILKYSGFTVDKFLVNRMDIISSNGMNHFNNDDLIIATVKNNNYQFNIDLTTKWEIKHITNESQYSIVNSNTNTIIISNNNYDNLYSIGYYNIKMNYSINGLNDQIYHTTGRYRVNKENSIIIYPVIKEIVNKKTPISYKDVISNFEILYENVRGQRITSTDVIDPNLGYVPIGIKILNAYYFGPEQEYDIYIGLKFLSVSNPDNGFKDLGDQSNNDIPYFGFFGIDIPNLKNYAIICYNDITKTQGTAMIYPQTDYHKDSFCDENGEFKWPAPNDRGWQYDPQYSSIYGINLLNDDDTFNSDLIDEDCAVSDWNGYRNTKKIIDAFSNDYDGWKTSDTIINVNNDYFSPVCACAWRYHTYSTNQGDWYIPSYAEVFFLSYNFKRLTNLFNEIAELYPDYCKKDLLDGLEFHNNALWTSTENNESRMWEIHPAAHAHPLSKTTKWNSFPYIRINPNL